MTLEELTRLDLPDLYVRLGKQVAPLGFSASDDDAEDEGRKWVERNLSSLRARICSSPSVARVRSHPVRDAAAIADALSAALGGPAVLTVSVILAKRGIDVLCPQPAPPE